MFLFTFLGWFHSQVTWMSIRRSLEWVFAIRLFAAVNSLLFIRECERVFILLILLTIDILLIVYMYVHEKRGLFVGSSFTYTVILMKVKNDCFCFLSWFWFVKDLFFTFHFLFVNTYFLSLISKSNVKPWYNLVLCSLSENKYWGAWCSFCGNLSLVWKYYRVVTTDSIVSMFQRFL